jgi:hypothetical protein
VADLLAHPPDLALSALVDRQLERVRGQTPDPRGRRWTVVELNAGPQRAQRPLPYGWPRDHRAVGLVDLEARVREPVGELAIVGQEDQTGGVGVQPANREQAKLPTDQADDGRAPLRVTRCRYDARRLVDGVHHSFDRAFTNPAAVERDLVARSHVARWIEHRLATDPHPPGADDLL